MRDRPKIVPFLIEKGGAGKTTSTVHVARALGAAGRRVLVVDIDPQHHASTWLYAPPHKATVPFPSPNLYHVLTEPERGLASAIIQTRLQNVDLIHGTRALAAADALLSVTPSGESRDPYLVLKQMLAHVPVGYDFVLIDCPPSVGTLNANAMIAADRLVITCDPSDLTYEGFTKVALTLAQMMQRGILPELPSLSVLFTIANPRGKSTRELRRKILGAKTQPYHVFETAIRPRAAVNRLFEPRKFAWDVKETQDVAADYDSVARELEGLAS